MNEIVNTVLDHDDVPVFIELLPGGIMPEYSNLGDAGMDVRAAEDVVIYPGQTVRVRTGIKVSLLKGFELQVRPRSGISLNTPLRVSNSPGTIDCSYKDEVQVLITNTSDKINVSKYISIANKGNEKGIYAIEKGDRIAQLVLQRVPKANLIAVDSIADIGENRGGGFGSTGVK